MHLVFLGRLVQLTLPHLGIPRRRRTRRRSVGKESPSSLEPRSTVESICGICGTTDTLSVRSRYIELVLHVVSPRVGAAPPPARELLLVPRGRQPLLPPSFFDYMVLRLVVR